MRRVLVFSLVFICAWVSAQQKYCVDDLFPRQDSKNRLWGYSNLNGDWIVKAYYDKVARFNGSIAIVNRRSHYGAVNCEGKLIFQCDYDEMLPFMGGYSWASIDGKWGLLKYDGQVILDPQYDEVEELSTFSPYTVVRKGDTWLLYNKREEELLNKQIKEFKLYYNNYLLLTYSNGKQGLLNLREQTFTKDEVVSLTTKKGRVYLVEENGSSYFMKYNGTVLSEKATRINRVAKSRYVAEFSDGHLELWDGIGRSLSPLPKGAEISRYSEGAAVIRKGDKYGYISYSGKVVIPIIYDMAMPVDNRIAIVSMNDSSFIISRKNRQLSHGYDEILHKNNSSFYVANSNGKFSILSQFGKPLVKESFDSVYWSDRAPYVRVKSGKGWYMLDLKKSMPAGRDRTVYADHIQPILNTNTSAALIYSKGGLYGLIDSTGAIITDAIYDSKQLHTVGGSYQILLSNMKESVLATVAGKVIWKPSNVVRLGNSRSVFGFTEKGKYGVYSLKLKRELIPMKYLDVKVLSDHFVGLKTKKGWQIAKINAELIGDKLYFEDLKYLKEKLVPVRVEGKWGYFDPKSNKFRISCTYEDAEPFENGSASVIISGLRKTINKRGQVLK